MWRNIWHFGMTKNTYIVVHLLFICGSQECCSGIFAYLSTISIDISTATWNAEDKKSTDKLCDNDRQSCNLFKIFYTEVLLIAS